MTNQDQALFDRLLASATKLHAEAKQPIVEILAPVAVNTRLADAEAALAAHFANKPGKDKFGRWLRQWNKVGLELRADVKHYKAQV